MSEKDYRHSFLNPNQKDSEPLIVNRFGHTILGGRLDQHVLDHEEMEVVVDHKGDVTASRKQDIFQHPAVQSWAMGAGIDPSVFTQSESEVPESHDQEENVEEPMYASVEPSAVLPEETETPHSLFERLPTSLQELEQESRAMLNQSDAETAPRTRRFSSNPTSRPTAPESFVAEPPTAPQPVSAPASAKCSSCQGTHPENARFCPHCGQCLTRFCIQCGYQFKNSEKFCPDCGSRR